MWAKKSAIFILSSVSKGSLLFMSVILMFPADDEAECLTPCRDFHVHVASLT